MLRMSQHQNLEPTMGRATRSITASTAVTAAPEDAREIERAAREALEGLRDEQLLEVNIATQLGGAQRGKKRNVTALLPVGLMRRYLEAQETPGRELLVFDSDEEVSSEVAAGMLGVSRPYLNELLEVEAIPYRRVGNQRRIRVLDLEAYRQRRTEAERALGAMADIINQSSGGWG
jgi:excisionase family DNA binding protein